MTPGGVSARPPAGKPIYFGPSRSTRSDATRALGKASRYLDAGGAWTDDFREYVDRWLDYLTVDYAVAKVPEARQTDAG